MPPQPAGVRNRALIFISGALLLGLLASGLFYATYRQQQRKLEECSKPLETVDVVVATRPLNIGVPLSKDDVVVRKVYPAMVPAEGVFHSVDELLAPLPRTPRERILPNEILRTERLAQPDQGVGLNAVVTPGKRAMTVATDTESSVAGLLTPSNFVDVIVTIRPDDAEAVGAKWVTETILQGVKVLAVGDMLSSNPSEEELKAKAKARDGRSRTKPSITLEVTPQEAEKLALALSRGDIHVVLRSDIDLVQVEPGAPMTPATLIGFEAPPPEIAPPPTPQPKTTTPKTTAAKTEPTGPTSTIIQGSSKTEVTFQTDGTTDEKTEKNKGKNK